MLPTAVGCGYGRKSFMCDESLRARGSLKKLKVTRGHQARVGSGRRGEVPPPLVSPWP